MLGSVSGSVLENMLPGEKSSVISTAKLNMAVERSDPDSTGGSSIGDGLAGFRMPSFGKLFSSSSSDLDAPVDKQVRLNTKKTTIIRKLSLEAMSENELWYKVHACNSLQ